MSAAVARLKEPSTWAAIAGLLAAFGIPLSPEGATVFAQIGAGVAGLLGILITEKSK